MRRLSWLLLGTLVLSTTGCGPHSLHKDFDMSTQFPTQKHCFGRYEIELPNFMYMKSGNYSFDNFGVEIVTALKAERPTIEKDWVNYINGKVAKDIAMSPGSKIIHQDMKSNPRMMLEYIETSKEINERLNSIYMLHPYYLRSFSERKEWMLVTGKTMSIPRPQPSHKLDAEILRQVNAQMRDIAKIAYHKYPHYEQGYCLDDEYQYYSGRLEKRDRYTIIWRGTTGSADTHSRITLNLESLNKDEQSVLDSRISKGKLLRTFFSSTTVVVGGIKGELYISHAKLNPTAREFQWLPSGTELGNRLKPLIMIDGRIDTHDFPAEYRDKISGEEMILWILESIKMRTGGDEDILSHR
ncbi:hypothetical protein [Hafnia paralvei]|uniref:hypothetical protein n=1 Tax=Hafnia paralvei TaxID=546367 RepID=UPI001CCC133A|nr:hypothetical protein [Hafnia paralvei]UBM39955.1 hypothetical protein K9N75_16525 [Hafnia paralvei]